MYMDIHRGLPGITSEQMEAAHQADVTIGHEEDVHFKHAWADPDSGIVFCLSEGPSASAVRRVHERAGHPADEIHPVTLSV